jgi:hypothetical protein
MTTKTQSMNLWYIAKEVLRGKFIAMSVYFKNTERSQISNLITPRKTRTS